MLVLIIITDISKKLDINKLDFHGPASQITVRVMCCALHFSADVTFSFAFGSHIIPK